VAFSSECGSNRFLWYVGRPVYLQTHTAEQACGQTLIIFSHNRLRRTVKPCLFLASIFRCMPAYVWPCMRGVEAQKGCAGGEVYVLNVLVRLAPPVIWKTKNKVFCLTVAVSLEHSKIDQIKRIVTPLQAGRLTASTRLYWLTMLKMAPEHFSETLVSIFRSLNRVTTQKNTNINNLMQLSLWPPL
jgi:hypothetical protein